MTLLEKLRELEQLQAGEHFPQWLMLNGLSGGGGLREVFKEAADEIERLKGALPSKTKALEEYDAAMQAREAMEKIDERGSIRGGSEEGNLATQDHQGDEVHSQVTAGTSAG